MKKLKIELVVAVFIFISCISSGAAFANQSSVSLEAPNSVERGTEITIKAHVTHSANNFFHYTKWVSIKVNDVILQQNSGVGVKPLFYYSNIPTHNSRVIYNHS